MVISFTLNVADDNPMVTPTNEEYDGEFSSRDMDFDDDDFDY